MNYILNKEDKKVKISYKIVALLLLSASIFYCASISIDGHHDGFMFKLALDVSRGKIIFKEAATTYGPLVTFIQAFAIKLLGESILSIRLISAVFYVMSFIMFFKVFKRFMPEKYLIVCEMFMLFCAPFWLTTFHAWSSLYAIFFQLGTIWCIIRYFDRRQDRYILLSGIMTILAFFCRQTVGMVLVLAFVLAECVFVYCGVVQVKRALKQVGCFLGGILIIMIPFLVYLYINDAVFDWWEQNLGFLATYAAQRLGGNENAVNVQRQMASGLIVEELVIDSSKVSGGYLSEIKKLLWHVISCLIPLRGEHPLWLFLPITNVLVFTYAVVNIIKRKIKHLAIVPEHILLTVLSIYSVSSWHQYYPVAEPRHYYWAGFPMFGFLFMAFLCLAKYFKMKKNIYIIALLLTFTTCSTAIYSNLNRFFTERIWKYTIAFHDDRVEYLNGLRLSAEQTDFYLEVYNTIEELRNQYPQRDIFFDGFTLTLLSMCDNGYKSVADSNNPIWIMSYNEMTVAEVPNGYFKYKSIMADFNTQELEDWSDHLIVYLPLELK